MSVRSVTAASNDGGVTPAQAELDSVSTSEGKGTSASPPRKRQLTRNATAEAAASVEKAMSTPKTKRSAENVDFHAALNTPPRPRMLELPRPAGNLSDVSGLSKIVAEVLSPRPTM